MPWLVLGMFLDWLDIRGAQVICCGDQGQPPPIAGEMLHDWFQEKPDYYEEVGVDYRAEDPTLKGVEKAHPPSNLQGTVRGHAEGSPSLSRMGPLGGTVDWL